MVWIAVLTGIASAFFFLKRGLYEAWAFFINLVISVYLAITLGPILAGAMTDNPGGWMMPLSILGVGAISFAVLYGLTYFIFICQFETSLSQIADMILGGIFGFLSGTLVWGFVAFVICSGPVSEDSFLKKLGGDYNFKAVATWAGVIDSFVGKTDSPMISQRLESILEMEPLERTKPIQTVIKIESEEPKEVVSKDDQESSESKLGLPPMIDLEEI